jgi:proline dehydrogenase
VESSYKLIEKYQVPQNRYEFQMLYGVTPDLRQSIIDSGHKMRVYVPFGKQWFNYSTRRLKENPKVASHIIKALFIRG